MPKIIERKVKAAAAGSATGAVWGLAAIELLDRYVIGPDTPDDVPALLQLVIMAAASALTAYAAGRRARHTPRPDLPESMR